MSKSKPQVEVPEKGIVVHITPKDNGYVGYAKKDGKILQEITEPTVYLSVAGQLRRYIDMGLSL